MTKLSHSYSALKQFDNCPKQYHMQRITKEVKASSNEASIYGERVHEQLEQRLKGGELTPETIKYEELCQAFESGGGELLVEQELCLNKDLVPTGWWDDDAWLRSKLDVLKLNGTTAGIGDWKTGKYRPDFFQLELFVLQVFKHYPSVQKIKASFIWLKDMKLDSKTYQKKQEPALWNKFFARVQRIEAAAEASNWPAKPSGLCPWCPAKHICEFARI